MAVRGVVPAVVAWLLLLGGTGLHAQVESASPVIPGTAYNHSALVRGYGSVGLNPAHLGMPGNPTASVSLVSGGGGHSLGPITAGHIHEHAGAPLPDSERRAWISAIEEAGAQSLGGRADASLLTLQLGSLGVQYSGTVVADGDLHPDAAELLLFGNAGRTGEARDFELEGSRIDGAAHSSLTVSYGRALRSSGSGERALAVGVAARWVVGHAMLLGRDAGSRLTSDPPAVELDFPVVHTSPDAGATDRGQGPALDVGASWRVRSLALSLAVRNAANGFRWEEDSLELRPGSAFLDQDRSSSSFDPVPFEEAPDEVRRAVRDLTFGPTLIVGTGFEPSERLSLSADLRRRFGDGIHEGPELHAGVGAELRPVSLLSLRAGGARVTDGYRVGGGLGLALGPVHLGGSALYESGDPVEGTHVFLGLSVGSP